MVWQQWPNTSRSISYLTRVSFLVGGPLRSYRSAISSLEPKLYPTDHPRTVRPDYIKHVCHAIAGGKYITRHIEIAVSVFAETCRAVRQRFQRHHQRYQQLFLWGNNSIAY